MRNLTLSTLLVVLVLCLDTSFAYARRYDGFGPFTVRDQNPIYLQSLSLKPMRAEVLPQGVLQVRIDSAYSNLFEQGNDGTSILDLDMELWRLSLNTAYGLRDDLELAIEIPLLHFNGGFLDAFVQDFHRFFHLPNGGRDRVPNNRFSYRFESGGQEIVDFPPADLGLGDIVVTLKQQMTGEDSDWPALAWFAQLKFPTGRGSRGFGSGTFNFGLGTALDATYKRLHGYFNTGYYVVTRDDALEPFVHSEVFAYMAAGELTLLPNWSLVVQLAGSTPMLKGTSIDAWNGVPLNLIIGFRGEERGAIGGGDFLWQVAFSEDVTGQGPSVDFTVFISLGVRFDLFGRARPVGDWLARTNLRN